ncbi:MAG TPA: Ig-like domain-containing protein [Stellaceae bacterium]|nr:Ig-like domain-containing protein [Stellaceae bacterium]
MPVTLSNLTALSGIAGFDLGTLFNNGSLSVPDSQFNGSVVIAGNVIAKAVITAGVDPAQNGIPLFEALAGAQYDNLSSQSLIQLLLVYARQAGTGTAVPQDVGAAIANLAPGTLTAAQAVSYVVQAANEVAIQSTQFGVTSTVNANTTGTLLGTVLAQLQGVLGSDPIAAGVQDLVGLPGGLGTTQFNMLAALGVAHAASIAAGFEGLLGTNAQPLTIGDLTLASPSAGTDIANAIFAEYGSSSIGFSVGAALIQALAPQNSVDPVPALVYFTYQLGSLTGGISTVVETALSAFITNALVSGTMAATDITNATIAIASGTTTTAQSVLIGEVFADLLNKTTVSNAVLNAVNASSNPQPAVIAAINGTTLTYNQGLGLLVGVAIAISNNGSVSNEIGSEISTLVTGGHITQAQVVNLLAANQADGLTSSYMTSSGLTFAQIGADLATEIQASQITATQALAFLGSFYSFSGATAALQDATITLATSLVNGGQITAAAAFDAIHTTDPVTILGILATTSGTIAGAIANYQYLLDNSYIDASDARSTVTTAQSNGTLSPVYNSALPAGLAAASAMTNTDAPSGSTLSFAALPSGVSPGLLVVDLTRSGAIADDVTVASISGNTVTLSGNVASDVASGDTIAFYNQGIALAIELLTVTPAGLLDNTTPNDQIFTYINNGNIGINEALSVIVNAVAASGGTVTQQIAELALVAGNSTLQQGTFDNIPNTGLMAAAAQEILTLYDGASLTASQLAAGFALAIENEGGNLVNHQFTIKVLTDIASLTDQNSQSALPLVAAAIGDLIATTGGTTASQPLFPSIAASYIVGGGAVASSNAAVSLLIAVAGQAENADFTAFAGQYIANGVSLEQFNDYFATTLSDAVTAGTIDTVDAALLLGAVAAQATDIQSVSQTSDYITQLAGYAGNSSVIPAFGDAIAGGYDAYIAIEALALIGGGAPGIQADAQNEIISILRSGANSVSGDTAIRFLATMSQLVSSSPMSSTLSANVLTGIAGDIAAIIHNNFATVTSAVTDIGDYVGSVLNTAPNVAANAITLLEYLATNDTSYSGGTVANLEQLAAGAAAGTLSVQSEIALILGAREIGLSTAVTTLDSLQATVGSGTPLFTIIANELALIDTTGVALAATAAMGTPTQALNTQAVAISQLGDNLVVSEATDAGTSSGTTLRFATAPAGVAAGLLVVDLSTPSAIPVGTTVASTSGATVTLSASVASAVTNGDNIAFYRTPVDSAATSAATTMGGDVLTFASVPGDVLQGMVVVDLTNPAAFPAGTTIAAVGTGTLTLSGNVAATVGSGDTIAFYQPGEVDVLNALLGNVAGSSVTAVNAITLLLDLAAIGAANTTNPALADATNALVSLATSGAGGVSVAVLVSDVSAALFGGTLTSTAGLGILAALAGASGTAESYVQSAYAQGLVTGYFTIAQIDSAVTAGTVQPLDAIAALSQAAGMTATFNNPVVTVTNIATEIVKILQADPGLDTNAVLALLTAASPTPSLLELVTDDFNPTIITSGYSAINTIVTAIPSLGQGFFSAILGLTSEFSTDSGIVTPAEAELFGVNGLVATGAVGASSALTAIVAFPQSQQLPLLVALAGVPSAQSSVTSYINQIVDNPGNTDPFITVDTTIAAFATAYGGASGLTTFYEQLLTQLGQNGTGATAFVNDLENSNATGSQQLGVLVNLLGAYQVPAIEGDANSQAIVNTFVTRVDTLLTAQAGSPAALASALATLLNDGIFTGTQVIQTVADFYSPSAPQAFLGVVAALPGAGISAATIASGIVSAVAANAVPVGLGVDLMLVIATQTTPALRNAAASAFGNALANSSAIAVNAANNIGAALSVNVVTPSQVVTFMTQVLLTTPSTLSFVTSEIGTMVSSYGLSGLQVITGMALALAPNALVASGATNAATASGATLDFASVPAGVAQALTAVDLDNPGAIPFGDEVTGVTGTTVTLSLSVDSAVANGDTIAFYNNITEDDTIWGQIAVLGAAIATLSASYGFSALQESTAILAAAGSSTADLNPDYGISLLAAFAGQNNSATNLEAAGEAVAALVIAGTVSPFVAAADLYNAYTVMSVVTPAQLVNVAVGLLSGGSAATAAQLVEDLRNQNQEPMASIVTAFNAAIGTGPNTVTALGIVDVAALLVADGGALADAAALVAPLLAGNVLTGQAIVAEAATLIGAGLSVGNFMSLFSAVAATTGSLTAEQISMGVGLGAVIANNQVSFTTAAADLELAINGSVGIPSVITLDQGLAILVGVGAGSSAFAVGQTIAALVAGSATDTQTAVSDIETALPGTLTAAQALTVLTGMVSAGGQSAAGAAVATLYQAGKIAETDLDTLTGSAITGTVPQTAAAFLLASVFPVATAGAQLDLINQLAGLITRGNFPLTFNGEIVTGQGEIQGNGPDGVTQAMLGDPVSGPGIPGGATIGTVFSGGAFILADGVTGSQTNFSGTFTVTDNAVAVEAQIVAALPPSTQLTNLIQVLVGLGTAASPAALGETLFSVIESGAVTPAAVVAAIQATGALGGGVYSLTPIFALGSLAQMAQIAPSGTYAVDPALIQTDVYNAIVQMYPPSANGPVLTAAQFVAQGFGALIQQSELFKEIFLPVLVQLAVRDPNEYLTASGGEFNAMLGAGAITVSELIAAMTVGGVTGGAALTVLAGAIDITGAGVLINQNASVENLLLSAFESFVNVATPAAVLQSYATALQNAVGLPAEQAVGGLALLFAAATASESGSTGIGAFIGSGFLTPVGTAVAPSIAGLVSGGQITEANAYTVIGQTYQATGFNATSLPALFGLVGYTLNDTPAAFATAVAAGSYGSFDATVDILVRLTGIDGQYTGALQPPPFDSSNNGVRVFPFLGLAVGAQLIHMAGALDSMLPAILADIAAIPFTPGNLIVAGTDAGVSDDNKFLVLLGMAGAGSAAEQVAVGAAFGNFLNSGALPDVTLTRGMITYDQWALLLAGAVTTADAGTLTEIAQLLVALMAPVPNSQVRDQDFSSLNLPLPLGALGAGQLAGDIDTAVRQGALGAAGAVAALEVAAAASSTEAPSVGTNSAAFSTFSTMAAEVVALVNEGRIDAAGAIAALAARAGNGPATFQAAAGGIIGALEAAGAASDGAIQTAIDTAIGGGSLTVAQAVIIDGAAAMAGSTTLAATLGADIGAMIAAGGIDIADAVSAIGAGASTYAFGDSFLGVNSDLINEVVVLLGVAGNTGVAGLQLAVGQEIGALVNQNIVRLAEAITAIGNAAGTLTAAQSIQVLIGLAQSAGSTVPVGAIQTEVAVGGEFDTLIGARALTTPVVISGLDQAIRAGTLSAPVGFGVLVAMAAQSGSLTTAVSTEIASLINGGVVTADQALATLFGTAGFADFIGVPDATDATIAQIVTALESQTSITPAEVGQDMTAAATGGSIAPDHAVNILLALSAAAPSQGASQSALDALAGLLSNGIGASALTPGILGELNAGTLTMGTAISTLVGIAASVDATFPAVDVVVGGTMGAFVGPNLSPAQLASDLQAAVTGGALTTAVEAPLLAQAATTLIFTVNGLASNAALPQALVQLAENGSPTAAQIFADIEALAAAHGGNYDTPSGIMTGFGVLIGEMAIGATAPLQTAVAAELASLVSRNLITNAQAGNYIGIVAANGLSADAAVLLYATGVASPLVAGAGIAGLVNEGGISLTQALSEIAATVPGTLSVDGEIKIIAGIANGLTATGSLNTLSSALVQLIENHTATATQVFSDITTVAQLAGSYTPALGTLLVGIAGTSDATLQAAVSSQIATLISAGTLTATGVVADIGAATAAGQITVAEANTLLIPLLPSAGPALQAAIGAQAGGTQIAAFIAAQAAGTITAAQLVGVLTGMATDAYTAPNGGTAAAASFIGLYALANGSGFLASVTTGLGLVGSLSAGPTVLSDFLSVLGSSPANAAAQFYDKIFGSSLRFNFSDQFALGFTYNDANFVSESNAVAANLAQALGGFSSNTAQIQFETAVAASALPLSDIAKTLNSLAATGALGSAVEVASLVTKGTLSAGAAMSAIDAAAPFVPGSRLVYFLAALSTAPALQTAAAQEIANFVHKGVVSGAAVVSDIAAIADAAPGDDSVMVAISTPAAVNLLLAVYGDSQDATLRAAVLPQLVALFANPPSDITQTTIITAIGTAVTNNQMTAATALHLLIQMDGAGAPGAAGAASAAIGGLVAGYVGANYSDFTSQLFTDAATVTAPAGLTGLGWLLGDVTIPVSGFATAIGNITAADQAGTITGAQEAAMLLGVFPDILTLYSNIAGPLSTAVPAATTGQARLQLINTWISTVQAANGAAGSIITDIVNLVTSGAVTPQTLIADITAAGTAGFRLSGAVTPYQQIELLVGLANADPAALGAVTAALVGQTNSFSTGAYPEIVADLLKMAGGTMTFDNAILDVEEYAITHNADIDPALNELVTIANEATPGGSDIPTTVPYTTGGSVGLTQASPSLLGNVDTAQALDVINGRFDDGAVAEDIAIQVVEGAAGLLPNAPSLSGGAGEFDGFQQAAFYNDVVGLAFDLRLSLPQQGAANIGLTALLDQVPLERTQLPNSYNLTWTQEGGRNSGQQVQSNVTLTGGFFADERMATEIHGLTAASGSAAASNTQLVVDDLAEDLTDGYAETGIINMLASNQFLDGPQDAISALNDLLAPVMANESAAAAEWTQAVSYAWLAMKSVEYIESNYQVVTNADGSHTISVPTSDVPDLYEDLIDEHSEINGGLALNPNQTLVLTGLGALAAIQGDDIVSTADLEVGSRLTQTIYDNNANVSDTGNIATDSNSDMTALEATMTAYLHGFALVGTPQTGDAANGFQGASSSFPGIIQGIQQSDGKDVQAYVDLGARIAVQGVPGLSLVNTILNLALEEDEVTPIPNLQNYLLTSALGEAGGAASTALGVIGGIGSVGTLLFGLDAVDNALGINDQQKDGLEGAFGLLSETGNLLGNILVGEVATIGSAAISAATDLGDAFADMGSGNTSDLVSNAEAVATFYFEVSTFGFSPEQLGAVGGAFGSALVDLFSGNTSNLAADGKALGAAVLKALTGNLLIGSATATVEQAIANINQDWNEFLIGIGYDSPPPPPPPPPPPTITLADGTTVPLINDTAGDGGKAYQDPNSTSNYGQFYHGTVTDGYIADANVFVDPTGTGIFQQGDYTTTTDAAGNYSLPAGVTGTVVITGGTDIATGLPFTGTFTAPSGASTVTALTTLINAIAQGNGGDVAAATQQVDAALGLPSTVDPTQTNPILSTQNGSSTGAQLLGVTAQVQNTLSLLSAAGGTGATMALANAITSLSGGSTLDLTDATTVANIATSAGIDAMTAAATGMLASASNSVVQQQVANATDPQSLLTNITAVGIVTQGSTAQQLSQSIGNTTALNNTVSNNTGSNFTSQVTNSTSLVGNLSPVSLNPANGTLGVGAEVEVTLNVADPVSVGTTNGAPTLALDVNENATYDANESTPTALVFDYTVQAGDNTPELETTANGISLNGGTITDLVSNGPANLSGAQSAVPAGLLSIDTVPPPVPSAPVLAAASALGLPGDDTANTSLPTFTGTAAAGTTVTLFAGTVIVGTAVAGANGYSITLTNPLAQGSYAFTATATNAVGTVSTASAATTVALPGIPAITGTVSDQPTTLDAPIAPFVHVTITDPAAGATETLTISLAGGGGALSGSGLGGGSGTYTLSGTDAAVTSELDALVFTPSPTGPEIASTTIFELDDQSSTLPVSVLGMTSVTDYGIGTIAGVTPSVATGTLRTGSSLAITLTMSSPVTVTGTPTLSLNDKGGVATYDPAASTGAALVFDYTVGEGQQATALAVTGVNLTGGAAIVDGLGNSASLSLPPSATFGGLQVDTSSAGDLTGDGRSDLLMLNGDTGALVLDEIGAGGTATYTVIGGLGPEWQFEGDGSFLGGTDGFLLWDGSSSSPIYTTLVVGQNAGGSVQYTPIGLIGPEWQYEGNGPLLGGSSDDFLVWDGSSSTPEYGALAIGAVVNGVAQYTPIGGVGPNWQFAGVGDYLGDGKTGSLMKDSNTGNVVVGEDVGGAAQYTLVGGIGPEWQFEGSGNLLGHGQDDFLLWDGSASSPNFGAVVVGEVTGGSAQYTLVGGVGAEWQFLGVGDYDGASPSEFLMRNSNTGALVLGTVAAANGTYGVTYAQVGGVGPEWNFHTNNVAAGV